MTKLLPLLVLVSCIDPDQIQKDVDEAVDEAIDKSIAGCERIFNDKIAMLIGDVTSAVLPICTAISAEISLTPEGVVNRLMGDLGCTKLLGNWDCSASQICLSKENN